LNVETRASENLFGPQKNGVDLDEIQEVARAAEDTQNPNRHPGGSVQSNRFATEQKSSKESTFRFTGFGTDSKPSFNLAGM
jgi:hypothetical protein